MLRPLGRAVPTVLGEQQQRSVRVLVGLHILCRSICMYFKILLSFSMGNEATCTPGVCANGHSRQLAYLQDWDYSAVETWSKAALVCANGKQQVRPCLRNAPLIFLMRAGLQSPVRLPKAGRRRNLPLKFLQVMKTNLSVICHMHIA